MAVIDEEKGLHLGEFRPHFIDEIGEGGVKNNDGRISVVEQVGELVCAVAIVGVDRHTANTKCRSCRHQVFGRVVEVDGDFVLLYHALVEHPLAEPSCGVIKLCPGRLAVTLNNGGVVWL